MSASGTDWLPPEAWQAVWLTLRLAAVVTVILLGLAVPLAWGITAVRSRWILVAEAVVGLPVVLPPTVLGFYLLALFAPDALAGRFWFRVTGDTLAFSFAGLVLGSVLYSLPFAVQPLVAAMRSVPGEFLDAARALGGGRLTVFLRVTLPLSRRGLLVAAMLSFAHTVGEFGVVVMLGGSIPGRTRVASVALFDEVQRLDYPAAHRISALLLALSFALLLPLAWLQRRQEGPGAKSRAAAGDKAPSR
jgi:molybdate transport system permease protein